MSQPGSLLWFARHEARLSWRETLSMMTAGRPDRERKVAFGLLVFLAFMHLVAFLAVGGIAGGEMEHDLVTLIAVTTGVLLSASAILSQAMESVTRTFYSRSDLELILSSPARSERLFSVRLGAIALSVSAMSLMFIGPFINVLAWQSGVHWLAAYGVIVSVSLAVTSIAVALTVSLFQLIGPKRTRLAAQIAAAVIGGAFVIGLQLAAMFSTGTMSRLAFLQSETVLALAPAIDSLFWWPARAALGNVGLMLIGLAFSGLLFVATTAIYAPRFASFALAASSASHDKTVRRGAARPFRVTSAASALRRKERLLLLRDPWLMSQSLMQLLYLLPPALLLWHNYGSGAGAAIILVPVLVMAAGQLAGGLAWLTISGEDAPDLVLTAPVPQARLLRAKVEAVMQCIAVIFGPFVCGLLFVSPHLAVVSAAGIAASAGSATMIQFWFRAQAKRSQFRRRHTSSRIATFSEAVSSIAWAGAAAIAAGGSWIAAVIALIAIGIVAGVRLLSPARRSRRSPHRNGVPT